ncbi:hypothetical protein ERX46_06000 [Brumimicrobium glaciale]|uniref:Uncharacterized protein n=1 Tax=Brumimicrobium glaciale TaxID=200475 RepID=A0A4V1WFZ6_9FLAO|nr:DUF6090 family protein [Brumimicrobium glaciale]RYM34926.1 hypothetical protein ERX46_06000 [Brumimicrobium glaciale]
MIKFFRKFRQLALIENKTGKYFKYAIGEIILVVIGILIALQINTWNENRKSAAILENYYFQIQEDLKKDYNLINIAIYNLETNIKMYNEFKEEFQNQMNPEAALRLVNKLNLQYNAIKFNANTIKTLETTGDIKLIPPFMRNKLLETANIQAVVTNKAQTNYELFMKEIMNVSKLGYDLPDRTVHVANFDDSYPLYNALNINDNYREIVLILRAAFKFKNVNEQIQLSTIKGGKYYINILNNIINAELGIPDKDIESTIVSLYSLYEAGRTIDEIIEVIKQQDKGNIENIDFDISETEINAIGYYTMTEVKRNTEALKLFKLNTELYPEAWGTYDSYGACLLIMGDKENGIKAYKKSLALNPENGSAIKVLSELELEK